MCRSPAEPDDVCRRSHDARARPLVRVSQSCTSLTPPVSAGQVAAPGVRMPVRELAVRTDPDEEWVPELVAAHDVVARGTRRLPRGHRMTDSIRGKKGKT